MESTAKYRYTAMLIWDAEGPEDMEKAIAEGQAQADAISEAVRRVIPLHFTTRVRADRLREKTTLVRLAEFSPHEILAKVTNDSSRKTFEVGAKKYTVRMDSHRYWTFSRNLACVCCGLVGTRMILERAANQEHPHFNLYGEEDGELILMTKDHIVPVSMGGENRLENYQTMCSTCNRLKGSSEITLEGLRKLREIHDKNHGNVPAKSLHEMLELARKQLGAEQPATLTSAASRRLMLARVKGTQPSLTAKTELTVYRDPKTDLYYGKSEQEHVKEGMEAVGKIEAGTKLVPAGSDARRVIVTLPNGKKAFVYQGMLECEGEVKFTDERRSYTAA